jgi:hypothetical protein
MPCNTVGCAMPEDHPLGGLSHDLDCSMAILHVCKGYSSLLELPTIF